MQLKYLPPQSLACEGYRKQENEVKDLLTQSLTHEIYDEMNKKTHLRINSMMTITKNKYRKGFSQFNSHRK